MTKETGQGFIKAPRNIVFSRALNANCKIILLQLIDRYNYLKSKGKLPDDDYFYMIGADFESQTGLTAQTIQRNIIPVLVEQGFITKLDRAKRDDAHYKTYSYFKLNWDAINSHDGAIKKTTQRTRAQKAAEEAYQRRTRELEEREKTPENPLNTNTNTTINTNVKLNITETKDKDSVEVPSSFYKEGDYSIGVDNQMVSSWTFDKKVEHISTIYNKIIRIPKEEMTNPTRFDNFADASNEILDNYSNEVLYCFAALYLGENGEAATRKLIEIAAPAGEAAFDRTITDLLTYAARYCADDTPAS